MTAAADRLLDATAELLWERGYSATSPQAIQRRAGVGQGSMYHHFDGKAALAAASLRRSGEELRRSTGALLDSGDTPVDAVLGYLTSPRSGLRGCRLGRMVHDPEVVADDELRAPVAETLVFYQGRIAALLDAAQREGRLVASFSPVEVAATIVAIVQGAHVVARAEGTQSAFDRVIAGAVQLIESLRVDG